MKLDRRFLNVSFVVQGFANSPPDNPVAGTQYIVGADPTGDFAGATANSIAYYDGTSWVFTTPEAGELEVLSVQTRELLSWNGTEWTVSIAIDNNSNIAPVLAVMPSGTSLPATASEDDVFLKTDDAKIYTATAVDTWDSGTAAADGSRYASSTDFRIYESDGSALTSETVAIGGFFLNKDDNRLYIYDGSRFVRIGGAGATFAIDIHTLTAAEIDAKSFSLTRSIASGQESNTSLSVAGLELAVGVDFEASGATISWDGKGLDNAGVGVGDVVIVHYVTSAESGGAQEDFSFAYLVNDVRSLQNDVSNLSSDSDNCSTDISALEADIKSLRDEIAGYDRSEEIGALESNVKALQEANDDRSTDISALEDDVRTLQDAEDNHSTEILVLESNMRSLQAADDDHGSDISELEANVRNLQDEDGDCWREISALQEAVFQLRRDVDSLLSQSPTVNITYQFISETETGV